jgi:hypothetical protein
MVIERSRLARMRHGLLAPHDVGGQRIGYVGFSTLDQQLEGIAVDRTFTDKATTFAGLSET